MEPDLALVLGIVLGGLSVLFVLQAMARQRTVAAGGMLFVIAGGLVLYAVTNVHGNYSVAELPRIFLSVIDQYLL